MADLLVVGSKLKAYIKEKEAKSSGDLAAKVDEMVRMMLDRAVERAKANKRTTVKPQDV